MTQWALNYLGRKATARIIYSMNNQKLSGYYPPGESIDERSKTETNKSQKQKLKT